MNRVSCPYLHRGLGERKGGERWGGVETTVGVESGEGWKVQGAESREVERRTRREEERCGMGRERGERRERDQRDEREEGEETEREKAREESPLSLGGPEYQFPELCCAWRMLSSTHTCRGQLFAFGFVAPIRLS